MHKRVEDKSVGRLEWVQMRVSGDLWQKDDNKKEKEGLQDGSETLLI